MWLPRNDNVLLWVCGCIAAKGTYAEKTFSPEKNNRNEKLKGMWAAGSRSWRGILWITKHKLIVKQIFGLWLSAELWAAEAFCWIQMKKAQCGFTGRSAEQIHPYKNGDCCTRKSSISEVSKTNKQETFIKSQSEERTCTGSGGRGIQILYMWKSCIQNIIFFTTNLLFVFL